MWNKFEESPIEDETISHSFSSRGLFKILCEQQDKENIKQCPRVQVFVHEGRTIIAVEKSLALLESESNVKCHVVSLNAAIDTLQLTQSGNIVICCLSNGEVHGIHIKSSSLFKMDIKAEDVPKTGRAFVNIQNSDDTFYLTCSNGSIYCLKGLHTHMTENAKHAVRDKNLLDLITLQRISSCFSMRDLSTTLLVLSNIKNIADALCVAASGNELYFQQIKKEALKTQLPESYGGIKHIFNLEKIIILLTNSGHLIKVCPYSKTLCFSKKSKDVDVVLIDEMMVMENNEENIELLILTKPDSDKERAIKIIDYPSLKCKSELDVGYFCWLVQQPKNSMNLYYMSGQDMNSLNVPTAVEMILVSETHPCDRLKRLISKGHFEEAEKFGKQFELCLQPIYEAKAKRLLLDLCTHNENNPDLWKSRFDDLLEMLKQIERKDFFKNNRMIRMPSRIVLERYLREVLKHLNSDEDENHILEVREQLHRLETLDLIDPYDYNLDWQKFVYSPNLVHVITAYFEDDIPTAALLWKRHSASLMPKLRENELNRILTLIPNHTSAFNLVLWLRIFVPTVSNTHPTTVPATTEWSIQKASVLQYSEHWPDIGLEFATNILGIFEDLHFIHSDMRRQHERNIQKLRVLVNALQDLVVLKNSYNLIFTLDNYIQDSIEETALCILKRVHLSHLRGIVSDFLYPIFQENGTTPEKAIYRYILLLIANRKATDWLERAVICIDLLHGENEKMESALLVLENASVPWPETVAPLVKLRNSTHPLAEKINAEHRNQAIKILKIKYGWPVDSKAQDKLDVLIFRIIKLDLPEMIEDVFTVAKTSPNMAVKAGFFCCHDLVCKGKIETAYEFFKMLKNEKKFHCEDGIIAGFADTLETSIFRGNSKEAQEVAEYNNLLEFFQLITPKTANKMQQIQRIKCRFLLVHKYRLHITSAHVLQTQSNRLKFLDFAIGSIIERSRATQNVVQFIVSETFELSSSLMFTSTFGFPRICQQLGCLQLSCAVAYAVLQYVDCELANKDDFLDLALVLLKQQIILSKSTQNETSQNLSNDCDPLAYPLAYELLARASALESKEPFKFMELIKYVRIVSDTYSLTAIKNVYEGRQNEINQSICKIMDMTNEKETTFNSSFDLKATPAPKRKSVSIFDQVDVKPEKHFCKYSNNDHMITVKFVSRSLLLMMLETKPKDALLLKLSNLLPDDIRNDIEVVREIFFESFEQTIKAKIHDVWYIMAKYLIDYQEKYDLKIINRELVAMQLNRVFRHVITHKSVNFIDLFIMLIASTNAESLLERLGQDVKTDQQKLNLFTLMEMYQMDSGATEDAITSIHTKRLKQYYYMEFCKQDPTLKTKFCVNVDNITELLQQCRNKQFDPSLLKQLSIDFKLNYQQMLIMQIIDILRSQELQYTIRADAFGEEELVVTSSTDEIFKLCEPYYTQITRIKDIEEITKELLKFIDEINMYFYELYLCVIKLLTYFENMPKEMEVWAQILQFLTFKMVTRRRNRPGQLESDMWFQSQNEIGVLPKIARYRFPFKPIVENPLKDILDNELFVDNCESWFQLVHLHTELKVSSDAFALCDYCCMIAVKNSIADYKAKNDSEVWHLHPTNNAFLKSILRLVKLVHNPCKVFLILYFVSNYAPDGADQVEAAAECYKYAIENQSLITDEKQQEPVAKIKRKYPILKTQHLLYLYGLTDERFMQLVENPVELIYRLYHQDIIIKSTKLDVNALAKEISELHNLDLEQLQFHLLKKWLSFTVDPEDGTMLEDTMMEEHGAGGDGENVGLKRNGDDNVLRANYILDSWPRKEAIQFLVGHIYPAEGYMNTSKQLQMFECFSKLNDGNVSFSKVLTQQKYVALKCVHELRKLGYKYSVEKFVECDKIEVLKSVWQRNAQNPQTPAVLANICLGFDIFVSKVWNAILKRMATFNMVHELNALVDVLSCHPQLLHTDGLVLSWECVLKEPFQNANATRTIEQDESLQKALFRMQSCPVVYKLKLSDFVEQCIRLERPHIAAVLLAFFKNEEQRRQIMKTICRYANPKLKKEILNLQDAGILPILLNLVIKEMNL